MNALKMRPQNQKNQPAAGKKKREEAPESSLGMRITALLMNLILLIGSTCYIPTPPLVALFFVITAGFGSYLSYLFRDTRPIWLSTLPTVGTILLFTNFGFEVYSGYLSSSQTAVAAFVHLIAGLSALHCFDLRTRTDFSVASLIGLALLTFLTGQGKDIFFGLFIFTYTVLAGLLLFFDSSSRSHELGPSRALSSAENKKQSLDKKLKAISFASFLPVILLPVVSFVTFVTLPRSDSLLDFFIDNMIRARFPISAYMSGQLGKGGRSQALRGGTETNQTGGSSFTVKGGEHGTAGGAGKTAEGAKGNKTDGTGTKATTLPGKGENTEVDLTKVKGALSAKEEQALKIQMAKDKELNQAYENEGIDMNNPQSNGEAVVFRIASPQQLYIRKYALNGYDGSIWKRALPTHPHVIRPNKAMGFDLTTADTIYVPPSLPTLEVKQDFRAEMDLGYIVPAAWIPQIVQVKGNEVRLDTDATIKATEPIKRGQTFTVISQSPVYDLEVMRKHPLETLTELDEDRKNEIDTANSALKLTSGLSDKIVNLSKQIAPDPESNWFFRAEKISTYLRDNYKYENDGLLKKMAIDEDPSSAVENFLFNTKSGSCRHFATAHALLCRAQGIPARLVVGWLPGVPNKNTGYSDVKVKDAHVWTEVYVPYWNWVPFDPTPGGSLPAHEEGGNALTKFIRSGLANPFAQEIRSNKKPRQNTVGLDGKTEQAGSTPDLPIPEDGKKPNDFKLPLLGNVDPAVMQTFAKILGTLLLFGLFVVALIAYMRHREEVKVQQFRANHKPTTVLYLEVLSDLKRYELVKFPTETVDEISLRIQDRFDELSDAGQPVPLELPEVVTSFMELYTADRFGGEDNLDELTDISRHIKMLTGAAGK